MTHWPRAIAVANATARSTTRLPMICIGQALTASGEATGACAINL